MSKKPNWLPAERLDLPDQRYGVGDHAENLRSQLMREMIGAGVLEGFRVQVLTQSGPNVGAIEILNGSAASWRGDFLNMETGTQIERVELRAPFTEYWVEVEILWADSDPDARAFWDTQVTQTPPLPNGEEVTVSRVMTRKTPLWRVVQPIRNNPTAKRDQAGYAPVHFSDANTVSVIPICVLRTDGSGKITSGNPDSDSFGNDLATVSTSTGVKTYVKSFGYNSPRVYADSPTNSIPLVYGRKTSDQRPRMFESVIPPFVFGSIGEMVGGPWSDQWARDLKSAFDHLSAQIGQIKTGAYLGTGGSSSMGHFQYGRVQEIDPDCGWADLSQVFTNTSPQATLVVDPDQFINCAFWITTGPWRGFYAKIIGNDRTNGGTGVTRLYLSLQSKPPTRKDVPPSDAVCIVLQQNNTNWLDPPCPNSDFRGLNELDNEVVDSHVDWWSGQTFKLLGSRLNANKGPALTVAAPTIVNDETGEPGVNIWPRADVFETISDIRTKVKQAAVTWKGGRILFRAGLYDFDSVPSGQVVFELTAASGVTFEGVGTDKTVLDLDDHSAVMFGLSGCKDITFQDMTIQCKGTPISLSGCQRISFKRCIINGEFVDLTTPTMDVGSGDRLMMEDCFVSLYGTGFVGSGLSNARIRNCLLVGSENGTELATVCNIVGPTTGTHITDSYFSGFGSSGGMVFDRFIGNHFHNSVVQVNVGALASITQNKLKLGLVQQSDLSGLRFPRLSSDNNSGLCIYASDMTDVVVTNIWGEGCSGGISSGGSSGITRMCVFSDLDFDSYGGGVGLEIAKPQQVLVDRFLYNCSGAGEGMYIHDSSDRLIIDGVEITGSTLADGIYFNSQSTFKEVAIRGAHIKGVQRGIQIASASSLDGFMVDHCQVCESIDAAFKFKFTGSPQRFIFDHNTTEQANGLGLSIDMSSCTGEYFSLDTNMLDCQKRSLEIWTTGGGTISSLGMINNMFRSGTYCPVAIGPAASTASPVLPGNVFSLSHSHIEKNSVLCSSNGIGGMWLTQLSNCQVDGNIVASNDLWGIYCAHQVSRCSISCNEIEGGSNLLLADRTGAIAIPRVNGLSQSSIHNNRLYISGNNFHGIFLGNACEDNSYIGNQVYGDGGTNQTFMWAEDIVGSIVAMNQVRGTERGAYFGTAQNNMMTGNILRNMTGGSPKYFGFSSTATNNRGGAINPQWLLAIGGPGPDSEWGDEIDGNRVGNYLSTFNHAF